MRMVAMAAVAMPGTQWSCYTSTKVQILTPELQSLGAPPLLARTALSTYRLASRSRGAGMLDSRYASRLVLASDAAAARHVKDKRALPSQPFHTPQDVARLKAGRWRDADDYAGSRQRQRERDEYGGRREPPGRRTRRTRRSHTRPSPAH